MDRKKCVVVGGGQVALRKVRMLLDFGARVTVVGPDPHPGLTEREKKKKIRVFHRDYVPGDLKDARLVIAATDRKVTNRKVAREARRVGALVNTVDDPKCCDFMVPSFLRRGGLVIAVSTTGMSPALARKIRTRLEKEFGEAYAVLLPLIEEVRLTLRKQGIDVPPETWQETLDLDPLIEYIRAGKRETAKTEILSRLKSPVAS